ncbi:MAG: glycosyltransferase [Bryobacteraceae bacterium]|nr:glycosyltransferase [Bryobacteraceae bacterium]
MSSIAREHPPDDAEVLNALLALQMRFLDERLIRVENSILLRFARGMRQRIANVASMLGRVRTDHAELARYGAWLLQDAQSLPTAEQMASAIASWRFRPLISVIVLPADETDGQPALESLGSQVYTHHEAVLIPRTSRDPLALRLQHAAREAKGDYLLFLRMSDRLRPHALYCFAEGLQDCGYDLIYADHEIPGESPAARVPVFKPGWSPALLRHCSYIGAPMLVRKEHFLRAGASDGAVNAGDWHNLTLRLADRAEVGHIPRVLMQCGGNWAESGAPKPVSSSRPSPSVAVICSRSPALLSACLDSLRRTAGTLLAGITVIGHAEGELLEQLRQVARRHGATLEPYSGPFHFARMCNAGARQEGEEHLLFLNDDVIARTRGWLEAMTGELEQEGVGVVGALLRYPTGEVQHAGIALAMGDGAGHVGKGYHASRLWPWLCQTRDVSAVTGACMLVRRRIFRQLGGFDELFPTNYNDVDFCLRARSGGHGVVVCAVEGLVHKECQTRPGVVRVAERLPFLSRWWRLLRGADFYYTPSLAPTEELSLRLSPEYPWPLSLPGAEPGSQMFQVR